MFESLMHGIEQGFSDILPHSFNVPCFLKGAVKGFAVGLLVLGAIAAAPAWLATALVVGIAVVGVIGLVSLASKWKGMTDAQKSEALGEFAGGMLAGRVGGGAAAESVMSEVASESGDTAGEVGESTALAEEEPAIAEGEQDPAELRSVEDRPCEGEPVDGVTGELIIQKRDLVLPGALELTLERTYASGLEGGSCFGPKWRSTWGQWIEESPGAATFYTANGRSPRFEMSAAPGGWVRNPQVNKVRLRRTASGFEVRDEQLRTLHFERQVNQRWLLTMIEDRNANRITFRHDSSGAVREVLHSGGYQLEVEGTAQQIRRIVLNQAEGPGIELMRYEYDAGGRLAAVIDGSGKSFLYRYDDQHRIVRWEDRERTWYEYRYDAKGRCVEAFGPREMYHYRFAYDEATRTTRVTDSLGGVVTLVHNERLQVVARTDARGGVTRTLWDERSNKIKETDPAGRTQTWQYDADGNVTAARDPLGRTVKICYNKAGLPDVLTDAAGVSWKWVYDLRGNLAEAGLAQGGAWRYERDAFGNLVRVTDPEGRTRDFNYDERGLALWATDWTGNRIQYRRDAQGRVVEEIGLLGERTAFAYSAIGKLARVTLPTGAKVRWKYDAEGNLVRRTEPDGREWSYEYGAFDLLAEIRKPSGGRIRLGYDTEARLVTVENERREVYRYGYNQTGQVVSEQDFAGRRLSFEYDASGLCVRRVNGLGEATILERDAAGQLIRRQSADGTHAAFEYDANGRVTAARNETIDVSFERDVYGRVTREKQGTRSVVSRYDVRGLRTNRSTSAGHDTSWQYDANGLMTGLLAGDENLEFVRDAAGREIERRARGGLILRQEYDPLDRLTSQWAGLAAGLASPLRPLVERSYRYDLNGNPVQIRDARWGASAFDYDPDGRILSVRQDRGPSEKFTYDAAGDILSTAVQWPSGTERRAPPKAGIQIRYLSKGGRLERVGQTNYVYDRDGRVIEKHELGNRWVYEWTTEGRLRSVRTPAGERWTYEYDAFGRRVSKKGPRGTTTYLWDGATIAEQIGDSDTAEWIYEPGTFRPLVKHAQGKSYLCVTDQVGTPRELVTGKGDVAWSVRLRIWGESESASETTECPIRFQGQWFDAESGLNYNFQRYYDPGTGRYLGTDPIGLAGGTQTYTYVQNPLRWVDPLGLTGCDSSPRLLGKGSTADLAKGTTLPRNLREQLAVEQATSDPDAGTVLPLKMNDPRWPGSDGWVKMQQVVQPVGGETPGVGLESASDPITVHYVKNLNTGQIDDFKIVLPGPRPGG
ncbi:MAG: RHS repeat-associated core domain-containing protein [Bryobacteraceae bacterium]|jgi:RHS repeat-associated protein